MAKVFIQETTLTAIGDAIREKTGTTAKIAPGDMPTKIAAIESGGGGGYVPTDNELAYSGGSLEYGFRGNKMNWVIREYGDRITATDVTSLFCAFENSSLLEGIPFVIEGSPYASHINVQYAFRGCTYLKTLPELKNFKIRNLGNMFQGCSSIVEVPDSYKNLDWTPYNNETSTWSATSNALFTGCYSLRTFPTFMIHFINGSAYPSNHPYYSMADACSRLDEIVGLPVDPNPMTDGNCFYNTFRECGRLKNMTFAYHDGTVNWNNQAINLSQYIGYMWSSGNLRDYHYPNPILDKEVTSDDSYRVYKDSPDWFTTNENYSRYNHDSAVRTINSLPTTTGTGCTITFQGSNGSRTDGGGISTLTDAEIAVAAAKGWTVSIV